MRTFQKVNLNTLAFSLLSFLLPFQLSYHFRNFGSQVQVLGFSIDYLIPAIYVSDLVIILLVINWVKRFKIAAFKKYFLFIFAYITFVFINVYFSSLAIPAIYKWIKITEVILLALIIKTSKDIKLFDHFIKPLSYSVLFVCILALLQFLNKGSIGGLFYFFGERSFRFLDPGIKPSPYSTFSHPNSLAGFLVVYLLLLVGFRDKFRNAYFYLFLGLIFLTIVLTKSFNAYIALVASFLVIMFKVSKKMVITGVIAISMIMPFLFVGRFFFDSNSFVDREKLARASVKMIKKSPSIGVGLNNFIPNLNNVDYRFENSWQLQPVHNIFLLIIVETGIIGFLLVLFLLFSIPNLAIFLPILFTGIFDHYWFTLQQNILLLSVLIGFVLNKKEYKRLKLKAGFKFG